MVLKWRNSSSWVGFKNMGCSTLTAAVPFATAILARRQHFLALMTPMPK